MGPVRLAWGVSARAAPRICTIVPASSEFALPATAHRRRTDDRPRSQWYPPVSASNVNSASEFSRDSAGQSDRRIDANGVVSFGEPAIFARTS
jgi:hypothetical protein